MNTSQENSGYAVVLAAGTTDRSGSPSQPVGYTQFGTRSAYLRDVKRFESRKAAQEALLAGRTECGHKRFRVVTWATAKERLL